MAMANISGARTPVPRPSGPRLIEAVRMMRETLAGRYELENEIGRGGTGRVFLARDLRHDRPVAIKLLHPDIATALGPDRFLKEITITASFLHPNILPLYDSGSTPEGALFYVMPYVEGESLRARLEREGHLSLGETVRIAADITAALDFAHAHGIVHRDVKPENILLSGGRAMLADFGLARSGSKSTTLSGYVVGTPAYMSPEQASPGGEIDGRSDVYSLACVVYEMLAGEPPFSGSTDRVVLARHAVDPVPPLRTIRPGLPAALEAAVMKALSKVPADRFADAKAFGAALDTAASSSDPGSARRFPAFFRFLPLVGLLCIAVLPFALQSPPTPAQAGQAVVPANRIQVEVGSFVNATGVPALDSLGRVARLDLIWSLARTGYVAVVDSAVQARRHSVGVGRPTGGPRSPARASGPDFAIGGTYEQVRGGIELRATLTDLRSGAVVLATSAELSSRGNQSRAFDRLRDQLVAGMAGRTP